MQASRQTDAAGYEKRHYRYHRHHDRHESSGARRRDELRGENALTSAAGGMHGGRSSIDFTTRSEFATPSLTPALSRTGSVMLTGPEDVTAVANSARHTEARSAEELLGEEQERAASRITGLKKSLFDLGSFSNTTTQRLDETYYAVLEKTSMLQSTVSAMRELAASSREILASFDNDTGELEREVQDQLETLGQFDDHEKRIQEMQARIQLGRGKIEQLSARVDVVKNRVEGWEKADMEWQEKTRKRLKRGWIVTSVIVGAVLLLSFGARYASTFVERGLDVAGSAQSLLRAGQGKDQNSSQMDEAEELANWLWKDQQAEPQDDLRFLDEL